MTAIVIILFMALTPGILLRIPAGGSKLAVATVHGVVFAVALTMIYTYLFSPSVQIVVVNEGFRSCSSTNLPGCGNKGLCESNQGHWCRRANHTHYCSANPCGSS